MGDQKCVVFRINNSKKGWLLKEIEAGRVHQQWGIVRTSLKRKGENITTQEWAENYRIRALDAGLEHIDLPEAQKRHRVLSRMLDLKAGDLIVIPRFPEDNTLMILTVTGEYYFDNAYCSSSKVVSDFGHVVPIDPKTVKVFSKYYSEETFHLYDQMIGFVDICNVVNNQEVRTAIIEQYAQEGNSMDDEKDKFLQIICKSFNSSISDIISRQSDNNGFLHLVTQLFRHEGYTVSPGTLTLSDKGSSVLILERELPVIGNCCQTGLRVYVKVHTQHDNMMSETDSMAQFIAMVQNDLTALKFFISTNSDEMTIAQDFAIMNGVVYMPLPQFVRWLTSNLNYLYC